jgi:hypothetical protein
VHDQQVLHVDLLLDAGPVVVPAPSGRSRGSVLDTRR